MEQGGGMPQERLAGAARDVSALVALMACTYSKRKKARDPNLAALVHYIWKQRFSARGIQRFV